MGPFKSFVMNNKAFCNLLCNPKMSFHTSPTRIKEAVNHFFKLNNSSYKKKKKTSSWLRVVYWEQSALHVDILINLHHFTIEKKKKKPPLALQFRCLSKALTLRVRALDASKSQRACIILSKFTRKSKYAVINL